MQQNETDKRKKFEFSFDKENFDDERGFNYPSKITVLSPKEKLNFKFKGADAVTLYFGWNSPFKETHIHLTKRGDQFEDELEVLEDAPNGKYKFHVAIWTGKKIIIDDPDVIIRRGS